MTVMRLRRRIDLRAAAGQTAADYMGILLIVAVVIGALFASGVGGKITRGVEEAICRISTGSECNPGGVTADGSPPLSECVRTSSQRGIAGSVKIAIFKLGGGVEALQETRADGTVKITIKGNAKAGLSFGTPGGDIEGAGTETGPGQRRIDITGKGEYGRAWNFENAEEAQEFVENVEKKVKATIDIRPNLPFTDDDADIELPPHDETTYAGGVEIRGKAEAGAGELEGNLGVGAGATFNEDEDDPERYGDKTYYFEVNAGLAGEVGVGGAESRGAGLFSLGGSGQGRTRIGITYDREGRPKSMRVMAQADVQATDELKRAISGQDLRAFVNGVDKAKAAGKAGAGARVVFAADLDLTDPANLAAAEAFIDGRDPATGEAVSRLDAAGDLFDRFAEDSTMNARLYGLTTSRTGVDFDASIFGVSGEYTTEDAQLVDAYYRGAGGGGWRQWEACVRDLA